MVINEIVMIGLVVDVEGDFFLTSLTLNQATIIIIIFEEKHNYINFN